MYNFLVLGKLKDKLGFVIGLLIFAGVLYILIKYSDVATELITQSGAWAPVVALILYTVLAPTPITTDPITVVMSVTYGPLVGVFFALVGNTLAATVEYYIGYKIGLTVDSEKRSRKIPLGLDKLPVDSVPFLILGRMIPGYGSKVISLLAGGYKVPMKKYIWTTAATNLFGAFLTSYGGFGLVNIFK